MYESQWQHARRISKWDNTIKWLCNEIKQNLTIYVKSQHSLLFLSCILWMVGSPFSAYYCLLCFAIAEQHGYFDFCVLWNKIGQVVLPQHLLFSYDEIHHWDVSPDFMCRMIVQTGGRNFLSFAFCFHLLSVFHSAAVCDLLLGPLFWLVPGWLAFLI